MSREIWPRRFPDSTVKHAPQGQRSPRLKVIASNGRMLTGSSSFALAIRSHCPSWSPNASRVRSVGSTSHRCGILAGIDRALFVQVELAR